MQRIETSEASETGGETAVRARVLLENDDR